MAAALDETDRQIIDELQKNVRATHTAIAHAIGVSDVTVAARIRRLTENKIIHPTVFYDPSKQGLSIYCVAYVWTSGDCVRVARTLRQIEDLQTVLTMVGTPDISTLFFARDHRHAEEVRDKIAAIKGVREVDLIVSLRMTKFSTNNSTNVHAMLKDLTFDA